MLTRARRNSHARHQAELGDDAVGLHLSCDAVDQSAVAERGRNYAVTAYVLHLNEIVPADFELNDENLD